MGTRFVCVVLFALATFGVAVPTSASASGSEIPASVQATLLSDALRVAGVDGDPHPYDIEAVATTAVQAVHLSPGVTMPACESSPACADAPVYVVAMRGQFACNSCSSPPGERIGPGTVITLEFFAATMNQSPRGYSSFGYGDRYPDLQTVGVPVRLAAPELSSAKLLVVARVAARSAGEAQPRDVEMASGSLEGAERVFDPTAMFRPSSPLQASETVYLVAMHGRFHPVRTPAGARRAQHRPSRVLELIVNEAGQVAARAYRARVAAPLQNLGPVTLLG